MQSKIRKFLLALCLLQGLKSEISILAQDTTTSIVDNARKNTVTPKSVENTFSVDIEEESVTTGLLLESCSESCTKKAANRCQCNCAGISLKELCDQLNNTDDGSGDVTATESNTDDEAKTTNMPINVEDTTTNSPAASDEVPTNLPANSAESTASQNTETAEKATAVPFNCTVVGVLPDPNDCRRYYNCTQGTGVNSLHATEQLCPAGLAFNTEFSSCMRDLSPCNLEHGGFECNQAGNFPDPNNDTNLYYRCVAHLDGQTNAYHKYVVRCGGGRIYIPELGKCFIDLNTIGSSPPFGSNPYEPSDEQLIKAELKQWKSREKTKLKEEENRLKYAQKLQKELAKQQAKQAKEKAKAEKKQKKQQKPISTENNDNN